MKLNIDEIKELNQLPWLPDELINFLEKHLPFAPNEPMSELRGKKILEFGCGGSTLWFSNRASEVVSVETDERWYNFVKKELEKNGVKNVDLRLAKLNNFLECNTFTDNYFDIILVDSKDRIKCIEYCQRILKPNGFLILDNSERDKYKIIFEILKNWPLKVYEQRGLSRLGFEQLGWQAAVWQKIF